MNKYSLKHWLTISNQYYNTRPITWSVFDYETQTRHWFDVKSDALLLKRKLPHSSVHFHWYEDEFSRINVQHEPLATHAELCRDRALELRRMYSYLRLWYSGGADSHTALMSFVDNGIHLDEIVVNRYMDRNISDVMESSSREVETAALPFLRSIQHRIPRTKITIQEATAKDMSDWFTFKDDPDDFPAFDSLDGTACQFFLGVSWGTSKINSRTDINDWCDIQGGSKVRLWKNGERWYFYFVDTSLNDTFSSLRFEDFFISRERPELYLKTVYLLKDYHVKNASSDELVNTFHTKNEYVVNYNRHMGRLDVPLIAQLKVYNQLSHRELWDKTKIHGTYSQFFYDNVKNTSEGEEWHRNYLRLMHTLVNDYAEFWNVNSSGDPVPAMGYKGHLSKFYCLNDGKSYDSTEVGFK